MPEVHRGVCRVYAIFINELENKFYIQAASACLIKVKQADMMILGTLSIK